MNDWGFFGNLGGIYGQQALQQQQYQNNGYVWGSGTGSFSATTIYTTSDDDAITLISASPTPTKPKTALEWLDERVEEIGAVGRMALA